MMEKKERPAYLCLLQYKNNSQNQLKFIFHKKCKHKPVAYCISNGNITVKGNFRL